MIIAIVGPDGSGKSTLAKSVSHAIPNSKTAYLGHNTEFRRYHLANSFFTSKPRSFLRKLVMSLVIYLDDLYTIYKYRKYILITDRYPYDHFIQSSLFKPATSHFHWLLSSIFPKPDIAVLLHGNEEMIYSRKQDLGTENIKEYIKSYKTFLERKSIKPLMINTTENDQQFAVHQILKKLKVERR